MKTPCALYHRGWMFPRDPDYATNEFVISADEKTSIQARRRKHATQVWRPRTPMRVEHEYFRYGAWTYIAALDGRHCNDARRVFRIVDNCSAHPGAKAVERLRSLYPRLILVHAPVHATLAERLLDFEYYWAATARPFEWKFTRQDLVELLSKLATPRGSLQKYVSELLK